jgi:hypothetical protein
MTRQANLFPLPMSVLAIGVVAILASCAAGIALGTVLGKAVSIHANTGDANKTTL